MTITQMKYFVSVVKHKSISKAAKENYVSATSISMLISELENLYKFKLFYKNGYTFELTEEGNVIHEHVIKVLESYKRFSETLNYLNTKKITIHLGVSNYLNSFIFQNFLSNLIIEFPQYNFIVHQLHSERICSLIKENKLDFGFYFDVDEITDYGKSISSISLIKEKVCVLTNHKHPLASKSFIEYKDLDDTSLLFLKSSDTPTKDIKNVFDLIGKVENHLYYTTRLNLLAHLLAGNGVALFINKFITPDINLINLPLKPSIFANIKLGYSEKSNVYSEIKKYIVNNFNIFIA